MGRRTVCLALALCSMLAAGSAGATGDVLIDRPTGGTQELAAAGAIRHVKQIAYRNGSDVEFATKVVNGVERDFAFAGVLSAPVRVIDITNPEAPFQVAQVLCSLNQNDVQVTGDLLVMAADGTGSCTMANGSARSVRGFAVADISNPTAPKVVGTASISQGAHNVTVHPTQPLVYVSNSDLPGMPAQIHVWDISNPASPTLVTNWSYGPVSPPHDITFNAAGTRAYAASITHIDIIDTTDARAPQLITTISDPAISIAHQADPTPDGRYLIVSDELGGGSVGPVCPGGGLHVYDLSVNERAPVKVGVFFSDTLGRTSVCTAHVFRINSDGRTMAIAWYNDGVHVLDFGGVLKANVAGVGAATGLGVKTLAAMKMPSADTWSAKMWQERHPGYVFANDMGRGFDVFHVPALG